MKIIYAGTPEFAAVALNALYDAGHDITLVLTQPDRPAGRGMHLQASPVKQCALAHGTPVAQPVSLLAVKLWQAQALNVASSAAPGTVLAANAQDGVQIACGSGVLHVMEFSAG
eukprot:gene20274-20855_t